jgi:Ca2+-binding EF-hand superfamily protein
MCVSRQYFLNVYQDGTITWAEYICVISLILDGTLEERIKLIFNCFDEDGDGELTKAEFTTAAKRFSNSNSSIENLVDSVFATCDLNGKRKFVL